MKGALVYANLKEEPKLVSAENTPAEKEKAKAAEKEKPAAPVGDEEKKESDPSE